MELFGFGLLFGYAKAIKLFENPQKEKPSAWWCIRTTFIVNTKVFDNCWTGRFRSDNSASRKICNVKYVTDKLKLNSYI